MQTGWPCWTSAPAGRRLWPTAVLAAAPAEGCAGQEVTPGCMLERELRFCSHSGIPFALSEAEMVMPQSMSSASQLAALRATAQPAVVLAMLAILPAGIQQLEIRLPCAGPLLPALLRFRQLQDVRVTGSAAAIEWAGRGSAAALRKLTHLCLDCRQPMLADEEWGWAYPRAGPFFALPEDIATHLAPATRLTGLELRVGEAPDGLLAMCSLLPALRELRLGVFQCTQESADVAVSHAQQLSSVLPRLALALGIYAHATTEEDPDFLETEGYMHWVNMPTMSGIASLAELCLVGNVSLPPDWRQLSSLHALRLRTMEEVEGWGMGPLTALTALSHIELNYVEMPEVYVPDGNAAPWLAQLAALRPGVRTVAVAEEQQTEPASRE